VRARTQSEERLGGASSNAGRLVDPPESRRRDPPAPVVVGGFGEVEGRIGADLLVYAADWREAEERHALVLRQLAHAGIGQ
jgi:hypothetical protein